MKGKFIVFEGPDGCGKSTQARLLADALAKSGHRVLHTREPGGTPVGEKIRAVLLDPANKEIVDRTEVFLYMASRAQLVAEVIRPALEDGKIVICDRYLYSTIAYQGYGGKVSAEDIKCMGEFATGGLWPDRGYFVDVTVAEGLARRGKQQAFDRMEQKAREYHERVRDGFLALQKKDPQRIKLIDGTLPIEEIRKSIWEDMNSAVLGNK